MLNKSLIQFSVDGWGCVPSLLFTWGQTMVGIMKMMETSSKRAYATPRSAAPRGSAPADVYLHRRHSNTVLSPPL